MTRAHLKPLLARNRRLDRKFNRVNHALQDGTERGGAFAPAGHPRALPDLPSS